MKNQNIYNKVEFFDDLVLVDEDEETVIIGRTGINSYIKVPKITKEIVELLDENTIDEVNSILNAQNIDIDLDDLIDNLIELNFIKNLNGIEICSIEKTKNAGITFNFIKGYHVSWLFSKYMAIVLVAYISIAFILQVKFKYSFIPSFKEFFWHENIIIVVVSVFILDIILGLIHEFSHFLSARSLGNQLGYISIGRRLIHLVYQTKIENIWSIPRKKRMIIYISGITMDLFILATFIYFSLLTNRHSELFSFSRLIILMLMFGILFEFRFYMKTDIYFILADSIKQPNLYEDSLNILKKIFFHNDLKFNKNIYTISYSVFMILAGFIDVFLTINYIIPSLRKIVLSIYSSYTNKNLSSLIAYSLSLLFF